MIIQLEFCLHSVKPDLQDVRINISEILCAATQACDSTPVRCRIAATKSPERPVMKATFTLKNLRMNAFIALSHMMVAKPSKMKRPCPAMYVNGYGYAFEMRKILRRVEQALFAGDVATQHSSILEEGQKYANAVERLVSLKLADNSGGRLTLIVGFQLSLIELWGYLRNCC